MAQANERGVAEGAMRARFDSDQLHRSGQSGAVSRRLVIWISIPAILVVLVLGVWVVTSLKHQRARTEWKTTTLARLAAVSLTGEVIEREMETMKARMGVGDHVEWTGESVLVMINGEFLVYASRYGANNGFVDHLFLARGSDGRWYYSTYHFCNNMVGVMGDDPPGSIAEFATRYAVRQFDGKSDVCLEHTWPGKK